MAETSVHLHAAIPNEDLVPHPIAVGTKTKSAPIELSVQRLPPAELQVGKAAGKPKKRTDVEFEKK